jgi:hypothetical protein
MPLDPERFRKAVVLSLAMDGYIDLERHDGESYLYGDATEYTKGLIEGAVESIAKWYDADQDAAIAEVLTRRHREGRE